MESTDIVIISLIVSQVLQWFIISKIMGTIGYLIKAIEETTKTTEHVIKIIDYINKTIHTLNETIDLINSRSKI